MCLLEFPVRVRKMLVGYKGREDFGSLWMRRCVSRTSQMSRRVSFAQKVKASNPNSCYQIACGKEVLVLSTHLDYFLV